MRRTLKICLVCAAWAAIGSIVALSFSPSWLALISGLVLGSLGGYLTCDWKTVAWAIPHAWRRATSWRPNLRAWGRRGVIAILALIWVGEVAAPLAIGLTALNNSQKVPQTTGHLLIAIGFAIFLGCGVNVIIAKDILTSDPVPLWKIGSEKDGLRATLGLMTTSLNIWPVIIISVAGLLYYTAIGLYIAARHLPRLTLALVTIASKFLWHLYRLIHTEERWLCSVDIALGVALGWWFASPLIGGASGAAFWLVNRLLIAGYLLRTLPVRVRS